LTTNRVKNFDPAFNSRISIKLFYNDLGSADREIIWKQMLTLAGFNAFNTLNMEEISKQELNGREIKNVVKLCTAKCKGLNKQIDDAVIHKEVKN